MRRPARRGPLLAWGALALFGIAGPAAARDGPYVRMDIGLAAAAGMTLEGTDNDWSTKCDLVINPALAEVTDECDVPPPPTGWSNRFGGGSGIRPGIAFGYRRGRVRIEGEYFQRLAVFDERSDVTILDAVTLGKQDQEIEVAAGSLDDLRSHAFFANLYYDFAPAGSPWTPFAGFGAGVERAALHYFTEWKRNDDPGLITTFVDPLLRAKVAGTATIGEASLTDRVAGWQVLAGSPSGSRWASSSAGRPSARSRATRSNGTSSAATTPPSAAASGSISRFSGIVAPFGHGLQQP